MKEGVFDSRKDERAVRPQRHGVQKDTADYVSELVAEQIYTGAVMAGEHLTEDRVARLAQVSRTPARLALQRLASMGLIKHSKNKGAQVVSFDEVDAHELFTLRAQLEPLACRLSVPRLSNEDISRLHVLWKEMDEIVTGGGQSFAELGRINDEFHRVFIVNSGSRQLIRSIDNVMAPAMVARHFAKFNQAQRMRSQHHHQELIVAAESEDDEWAEAIMKSHLLSARNAIGCGVDSGEGSKCG